jgi:hypothetical protein
MRSEVAMGEGRGHRADVRGGRVEPGALVALIISMSFLASSCATVGRDFPVASVPDIRIGETTQADIREVFGPPWRVGIEDGRTTWTYGKYRYRLFGERSTTDLVVRFDAGGVVASYSFSTTEYEEGDAD